MTARAPRAGPSNDTFWLCRRTPAPDEARSMDELLRDFLTETSESLDRVDA